jgi:hypothetical protein
VKVQKLFKELNRNNTNDRNKPTRKHRRKLQERRRRNTKFRSRRKLRRKQRRWGRQWFGLGQNSFDGAMRKSVGVEAVFDVESKKREMKRRGNPRHLWQFVVYGRLR